MINEEYLPHEKTNQQRTPIDPDDVLTWFTQLVLALEETHHDNGRHRNMSSENIYLKAANPDEPEGKRKAMLGNFGNVRL